MSDSSSKPEPKECASCGEQIEPIQVEHPFHKEIRWVYPACKCEIKKLEDIKRQQESYRRQRKINHALKMSSSLEDIKHLTFESYKLRHGNEKAIREVEDAVENFSERSKLGVFIFGETGNGKSHITAAGGNALIEKGYSVLFITEKDLLSRFNATKNYNNNESFQEIMGVCLSADLLVWDDFMSSQRLSDEEKDWIFQIINGRERKNKPIWATSNLTPEEFESDEVVYKLDNKGRTWWRLVGNMNCVYNKASNYRKSIAISRVLGISVEEYERRQARE